MKTSLRIFPGWWWVAALAVAIGPFLSAQTTPAAAPAVPAAPAPAATADAAATPVLSADQLDQLTGPIALYPDALVALILPASTNSSDVVLAARYLAGGGDPEKTDDQPWDDSVKGLAHYPDVVKWMDENLEWTKDLGDAYAGQSADTMQSIQRLRAKAKANGVLVDTKEQQVVMEGSNIRIVPAAPDVIYVPRYDPTVVYVESPVYYGSPYLTFGVGFGVGAWLAYDFDWNRRVIWVVDRHYYPHYRYDWRRRPAFPVHPGPGVHPGWRPWTPPRPHRFDSPRRGPHLQRPMPHPRPFPNARPGQPPPGRRPDGRVGLRAPVPGSQEVRTHRGPGSSAPRWYRRPPPAPGQAPAAVNPRQRPPTAQAPRPARTDWETRRPSTLRPGSNLAPSASFVPPRSSPPARLSSRPAPSPRVQTQTRPEPTASAPSAPRGEGWSSRSHERRGR